MKKFLKAALFLCALSSLAYAEEATPVVAEANTTMSAEEHSSFISVKSAFSAPSASHTASVVYSKRSPIDVYKRQTQNRCYLF